MLKTVSLIFDILRFGAASTPVSGSDMVAIEQGGTTKKVSVANLTAGRAVDTGKLTVTSTDNQTLLSVSTGTSSLIWQSYGTAQYMWNGGGSLQFGTLNNYDFDLAANGNTVLRVQANGNVGVVQADKGIEFAGNGSAIWRCGTGTPEGAVTAPVGSLYTRTDGGAGTTLYVKESGAGNTGWIAK